MKKRGYTLQDQIREVTDDFAREVGSKLGEHGFEYRHDILMTDQGMRFVFEASINGKWPDDPLPESKDWNDAVKPLPPLKLSSLEKDN